MPAARWAARALVAAVFIHGGWCTLTCPGPREQAAAPLLARARRHLPALPPDQALVGANAAVHVAAGLLLAAGIAPRPAARVLALSLVPTTIAGHPARDESDLIQIVKNAGILGGLILAAADSARRP